MSDALHVLPPLIIAVVLIWSGIAKLRRPDDLDGWREMGVPAAFRRTWMVRALPWGEIALGLAVALLGGWLGLLAALAAVALMTAYLVLVWRVVRQPEDASCACFGEKKPVTRATVVRNAWLVLVVAVAASVVWWLPLFGGAVLAALPVWGWVVGAAAAAVTAALISREEVPTSDASSEPVVASATSVVLPPRSADASIEQPQRHVSPPPATGSDTELTAERINDIRAMASFMEMFPGATVTTSHVPASAEVVAAEEDAGDDYVRARTPAVPVTLGDGTVVNLRSLSMTRPILLLAVSETCASCAPVIDGAQEWRERLPEVAVHLLVTSAPDASPLTSAVHPHTLHDPAGYVRGSIADWQTPSAVLLGGDGLLAGGPVTGFAAIAQFVEDIEESLRELR